MSREQAISYLRNSGFSEEQINEIVKALEPTTKNDLVTLTFSKGTLKYNCKDYVVYKKDWLRSHYGAEIDIMFGDSQYKEPTTKNDLGVDCISRQAVLELLEDTNNGWIINEVSQLPSVTPQEPKTGHWIGHREHCENLGVVPSGLGAYEWCSNCDCGIDVREWHRNKYNYCPNCGAKMVEPQESEETEVWNGIHAQITAPKGTFDKIFNDTEEDIDDI